MSRSLKTTSFSGSTPRRSAHLATKGQAVRALDCKLWRGTLESWREPRALVDVNEDTKSVYQSYSCCWLTSTKCASWAEGSTEQNHVFATQYNEYPYPVRLTLSDTCEPTVYRLGLPVPKDRLVASAANTLDKASAPRQYLIQYEDSFGGLSSSSEPSNQLFVADGAPVQVSGWSLPTGGWDIQKIHLYRTVAGFESVIKEGENKLDSTWMLVATLPPGATSYLDTLSDIDLVEALREDIVEPPPEGLRGITWVKSMNCLAGFVGSAIYFSENNNYHNWPHKLLLDDSVKAIVECADLVYLATDGHPYVVTAAVEGSKAGARRAVRFPEPLPLVGGGHRSMIALPSGAIYPTHEGLVYMSGNRAPTIISAGYYAPDDWQKLHPDTAKLGYHLGRVFAFFRRGAFCIAVKDGAGTATDLDTHTELSLRPDEVFTTRTGRLLLRFGAEVKEWDKGTQLMPHTYESNETLVGVPFNFGAAQVMMEPGTESFKVFCDGHEALDAKLHTSEYFPLPLWATGQEFKWILTGTAEVKMVSIAPSVKEL